MRVDRVGQEVLRTYDNQVVISTVVSGVVVVDGYVVVVQPQPIEAYREATNEEIASAREAGELPEIG